MTPADADYLTKYRSLAARCDKIGRAIADLRSICESLKDWRDTARRLAPAATDNPTTWAWAPDRLAVLTALREDLHHYRSAAEDLQTAWVALPAEARVGLAPPQTLTANAPPP